MQRKKLRPTTVPVESLEQMQSELEAAKLEGQAIKEEWQQMNRRMKDAQQRLAAVEARNVFLEKADEARRLIHTDLRDTQRRLVETRDEHRRIQQESATRQLDLEQQVQDLRMIQDEVGHLLRTERAEKERLATGQATAQAAAAAAIARVGALLEGKALAEEEAAVLAAELAAERRKGSGFETQVHELRTQIEQLQQENDAKVAELVNHLDIVVGAVTSHGRTMVRHAGGFAQLGTVIEHECKREVASRAALATADKRWASKVPDLVADTNRAAAAARNRGRVAFQPFSEGSLYMRYKVAALQQQGSDKSEPILLAPSDGSTSSAGVCVDDEPTPWANRAVFPVSHTSPFWRSVSPSSRTSAAGTVALSSLSKGVINTKHGPPPSILSAAAGAGARPGRSRAPRKAPRLWSGGDTGDDAEARATSRSATSAFAARYGGHSRVSVGAATAGASYTPALSGAEVTTGASSSEKDLWADDTTEQEDDAQPIATTRTGTAARAELQSHVDAASIFDAVAAAAASSDGGQQLLQEGEAALNARVRALQLENAQLEEEFRRQSVASEAQQPR